MSLVKFRNLLALLCTTALVACGGGGSNSGNPAIGGSGGGSSNAASVSISTSNQTLGDGSSTITVTAVVKDANNVGLASAPVTWSSSAGSLTGVTSTTGTDGTAIATFSATDAERTAGSATITAKSGSATDSATVALQGQRTVILSSSKLQIGTDGDTATLTAVVRDSNNVAINGARVSWMSTAGALSGQTSVTNSSGVATATFTPTGINPSTTPTVTVSANSGGQAASTTLNISPSTTSIELMASQATVGTGGEQITITAFVKDGNNLAKSGAPVGWSVDSGRISSQINTTNSGGIATAILDAGSNKANRTALVIVNSGAARQTLSVPVINTKLTYSGATTLPVNSSIDVTLTVADSKGVAVPGVSLALSSALGNTVPATVATNNLGQAVVSYAAVHSGADTLSVIGAGATLSTAITVTGLEDELVFLTPGADSKVVVGSTQTLNVRYRKSGVDQPNATINFAATIGALTQSSASTGSGGTASVGIRSNFAGASSISATVAGTSVQATLPLNFVATTPASVVLQVTPSALAPNLGGSTSNQATVIAKVVDANGNPVADKTVNFSQLADPSGGRLQQASAVTDLNGVASVQYLSGAEGTANGGVRLQATVAGTSVTSGVATLTVNQTALFIALGTGNSMSNLDPQTYQKNWTVYVTDANGVAVTNVPLTVEVIPTEFGKGFMVWDDVGSLWVYGGGPRWCLNEDVNRNGTLDAGEDINRDGALTPGNVVRLSSGVLTTDAAGAATVSLLYAENYAPWIRVRLKVSAIVQGTESSTAREFPLERLSSDFSTKTISPPGQFSPFGVDFSTCTNAN